MSMFRRIPVKFQGSIYVCMLWVLGTPNETCGQSENLPPPPEEGPGLPDVGSAPAPAASIAVELVGEKESQASRRRTESESRQFVVHGADFSTRGAIASLAEMTRGALLKAIGGGDEKWEHAIAIQLRDGEAPMKTTFFQVPGGYRLQLDVYLGRGKPAGLERALMELLLVEYGLRGRAGEPLESLGVPPWLVEGMLESVRWKSGEREHALYDALFRKNELYPVKNLLEIRRPGEMDSLTRVAFRASSGALVMSLLGQDGGQESIRAMLRELSTFEGDEMALLTKHFPGMNLGPESFSKWWALQLAQMAEKPFPHVLNIGETEQELRNLLVVRFNDPSGQLIEVGASQFRDLLALPIKERQASIRPVLERGRQFMYRAFPAHRPLLREYLVLLGEIASDRDEEVGERLERLATERDRLRGIGNRTRDYLEWYRITSSSQLSGDFESFVEIKEGLESQPSSRRGPVSEYMNSMQRLFAEDSGN